MDTTKWTNKIDQVTIGFKDAFDKLSTEQLNRKPNPETWSVAQNIDHLMVINETYYPVISTLRQGNYQLPFLGRIKFMVYFLGKVILNSVQPDTKRKMKTFPIWEPSKSEISADILSRFEQSQTELRTGLSIAATCWIRER